MNLSSNVSSLYVQSLKIVISNYDTCRCCKKCSPRVLPDRILYDCYNKMFEENKLCLLVSEFKSVEIMDRMVRLEGRRRDLIKNFQRIVDHCSFNIGDIRADYISYIEKKGKTIRTIVVGSRIGGFLKDCGLYESAIDFLNIVADMCREMKKNRQILLSFMDCCYKKLHAEIYHCITNAMDTYNESLKIIEELKDLDEFPNLAAIYGNFAAMYFVRSEYDEAYNWSKKAIQYLNEDLPLWTAIDVLRIAAKACVVKRHLQQSNLLITQAMSFVSKTKEGCEHPKYSDVLMDYGFCLLNSDSIPMSVKYYVDALKLRLTLFGKNNILVAITYEDLSYAQYVKEYSSGNFYNAKDSAERSIRIMERILPASHIMLASAKRVKALILEEIALDMREMHIRERKGNLLREAEGLHQAALRITIDCFGEYNVQTSKHYGNLGRLYQTMELFEKAEAMHLKAIDIKEKLLGADDYEVGLSIGHLASLYTYHMRKFQDAERLYLRSIDIGLRLFGENYTGLEYDYRGLISIYMELQDFDNMAKYALSMRLWRERRDDMAEELPEPSVVPEEFESLIANFFKLELVTA